MRLAKAIFGTVGSAAIGLFLASLAMPEWVEMNLDQYFWQTIGGFIISAAFGGSVVFIAYATYIAWRLGDKPVKAFKRLKGIAALSKCESLSDVAMKVEQIDSKCSEMKNLLSAKDAEIAALKNAKVPTPLDALRRDLGNEGIASFRALCAASTYVDGKPARPLVFDLDDAKLSAIGLSEGAVRRMADAGAIRLAASDDRDLVGSNACTKMVDIGEGVAASSGAVRFSLAGGDAVEVAPVHLNHGTDFFVVENHLAGADLGIVSFTANGSELAAECAAAKPPFGMGGYIEEAYSVDMRVSRNGFRCLTEDGELRRP